MLVLISFSFLALAIQSVNPANTISGFIWLDHNDNGLQDPDEPGFAQTVPGFGAPNISLYTEKGPDLFSKNLSPFSPTW